MSTISQLRGIPELRAVLKTFPAKYQERVIKSATRAMAAHIQKAVKRAAPRGKGRDTGKKTKSGKAKRLHLYQTVKVKARRARGPMLMYTVHAGQGIRYAHLVHFGTKPHTIKGRMSFKGRFARTVKHPGTARNPFMSNAFERTWMAARDQFAIVARRKLLQLRLKGVK